MRLFIALMLLATPALANDGWGGLTATGLTFGHTSAVAMETEDLTIGPKRIAVAYTFRNTNAQDVSGEVIFPLPPISVADLENEEWSLPDTPDRPNLVNFTATVEGGPVAVAIDRIAVIEPENHWNLPAAAAYDTPGREVTARLAAFGVPLSLDINRLHAILAALPPEKRQAMLAEHLIAKWDDTAPADTTDVYPLWSIVLRYHWPQSFPAGKVLHIAHAYENYPAGGIFPWADPPEDYMADTVRQYCIDAGTSRAILKAVARRQPDGSMGYWGTSLNIAYVLRTANSWAGPIGRFRLTVDKGSPANVVSFCAEGVKKTGPTTFTVEKTNYTPDRDLDILIVRPPEN